MRPSISQTKACTPRSSDDTVERPNLSFADCFHIVLARKLADGRLVTFDQAAGKSDGIDWIEPA